MIKIVVLHTKVDTGLALPAINEAENALADLHEVAAQLKKGKGSMARAALDCMQDVIVDAVSQLDRERSKRRTGEL